MKLKHLYLVLCLLGLVLPYSQFIPYYLSHGFNLMIFVELMFANQVTAFISFDLLIAATAALIFIIAEGTRLKIKHYWVSIALVFLVGVSLGFPLFLYLREVKLEKNN